MGFVGGSSSSSQCMPGGLGLPSSQPLLLPAMIPRQCQLVDDILPSMQDLLTDCCE